MSNEDTNGVFEEKYDCSPSRFSSTGVAETGRMRKDKNWEGY